MQQRYHSNAATNVRLRSQINGSEQDKHIITIKLISNLLSFTS